MLGVVGTILTAGVWVYLHAHPGLTSAQAVAKKLGCTNVQQAHQVEASSSVTCSFHGDQVIVSWFDSQAQENDKQASRQHATKGSEPPAIVYGSRWAIVCTQAATCEAAKKAMS